MDANYIVWGGLALLVVGSLVVAYYSSRTWSVGHVVLVYLIFLTAGGFVYLSAKTLQIRQVYGAQAAGLESQLDGLRKGNVKHVADIDRLRHELYKLTFNRGGVWRHCQLANAAPDGAITVQIEQPKPHGIKQDTILFLFEEGPAGQGDEGAHYLGEFKVTAVDPEAQTATLTPAVDLTDRRRARLAASKPPWSLYEVMPVDRHDLLVDLDEAQLKSAIPPQSLPEYLRDGKPAKDDDPDQRVNGILKDGSWASMEVLRDDPQRLGQVVERRYVRQLWDYQYLFRELGRQRAVDRDAIAQSERDAEQLKQALARAKKDVVYREAEQQKLGVDLKGFEFERDVAVHHLRALEGQFANLQSKLAAAQQRNRELIAQLASLQQQAGQQIDDRTGALSVPPVGWPALSIR